MPLEGILFNPDLLIRGEEINNSFGICYHTSNTQQNTKKKVMNGGY